MKTKYLLLLCLMLLCFGACEKDTPPKTAPPITQENTFSCKINGELFVPEAHGFFPPAPTINIVSHSNNSWLFILGDGRIDIYIYIYELITTGKYNITLSDGDDDFFGASENLVEMTDNYTPGVNYISLNNNDKIRVLELELDNKFIFEFDEITLINSTDPEDVIVLSEGKLHVNLETLIE